MSGYTVIDFETTGLMPETHDRVVEIGVVYVSDFGEVQDQWSTVVNPLRDVGPTRIHGITAREAASAPTFGELAPYVLRAVAGRTIVAHNASFDLRFFDHEMRRAGVPIEPKSVSGLCTMRWSRSFLASASRRLVDCCGCANITLENAHSALGDARATAELLTYYLRRSEYVPPWRDVLTETRAYPWPTYHGQYAPLRMTTRGSAAPTRDDEWLDRIVSRMPRAADLNVESYLEVLEMAMLDGYLAEHERDQLVTVAVQAGLTRGQVLDLHGDYLRAMAATALDDHVVTADERSELERAATVLGLRTRDVDRALADVADSPTSSAPLAMNVSGLALSPGDRVVFTGEMQVDRSVWEERARVAQLEVGGVTKKTKVVVAADPDSMSGKAAKARSYGVPIITEAAFERLLLAYLPTLIDGE